MRIHFLQHESFEAPGAIELWTSQHHLETTYTRFYLNETLPENTDGFDYLIIMGGPQSPATTKHECSYFNASEEVAFIKKAIEHDKYVLGICLGAQLIGEALGAKYDHSPNREIGVFDILLTQDAMSDPIFSTFPNKFPAGHWHGDMPGLTEQSEILAHSEGCPRQIVKYSPKVYGFQCHFEFTSESIELMIRSCSSELQQYERLPYIESAEKLREHNYVPMNKLLYTFLDNIYSNYKSNTS